MRLNHPDYIKLVVAAYHKKRANNELSPLLTQSTPAKIRRECLNVYQERYQKKDELMLRAFFGPAEQGRQFLQSIRNFETDRFRPLDNYLKGLTDKTDDRNLELLAWLIDFEHRPYSYDNNVLLSDEELFIINIEGKKGTESLEVQNSLQEEEEKPVILPEKEMEEIPVQTEEELKNPENTDSKNDAKKKNYKRAVIVFLILVIGTGGIYALWQQKEDKQVMGNANSGCMSWDSDHYVEVPCNTEPQGRLILPMNPEKMKYFRKITRQDTITERAIGKIYYIKNNNSIECYTQGGNYPEDFKRILKVLSPHIFDKYLSKKEISAADTLSE